mgnify:CR=1 FL=1
MDTCKKSRVRPGTNSRPNPITRLRTEGLRLLSQLVGLGPKPYGSCPVWIFLRAVNLRYTNCGLVEQENQSDSPELPKTVVKD